jgi:hypothetical protein
MVNVSRLRTRLLYTDSLRQPRQYIVISRLPVYATIVVSLDSIYLSLVTLMLKLSVTKLHIALTTFSDQPARFNCAITE